MKFGPRFLWNQDLVLTPLAIGLNICVGIGFILAHKRYIAELDELQQRVYLNAILYSVVRMYDLIPLPGGHLAPGRSHESDISCDLLLRLGALSMTNRLKVLRAERNCTQAELADALDVSRQTVNAIETGKFDPSLPLALRIGRLFGQKVEEIFEDAPDGS